LSAAIAAAVPHQAVIDGEIVRLGTDGRPQFYELMRRHGPMSFCAFDLLSLDGSDLRARPLLERKKMLRRIVRPRYCTLITSAGKASNSSGWSASAISRESWRSSRPTVMIRPTRAG
jgi:bifunctional non-homologous end joining protein LigD